MVDSILYTSNQPANCGRRPPHQHKGASSPYATQQRTLLLRRSTQHPAPRPHAPRQTWGARRALAPRTANPLITRHVGLPACTLLNPELIDPGAPFHPYQYAKNHAAMRAALGCAPDDLYLPMIEADDPLLSDPVRWVRTNVAHYSNTDQEDN